MIFALLNNRKFKQGIQGKSGLRLTYFANVKKIKQKSMFRVREKIFWSKQSNTVEPTAQIKVRAREGKEYLEVGWLQDSGVYRTVIIENLYRRILKKNPEMKLRKNKV